MKPKVIFIDSVHPILSERLVQAGYQCDWKNELSRNEILSILDLYQGVVIRSKFKFDHQVFEAAKNLKWIARSGSGMENIDTEEAAKRGIKCFNSPEGNRDAVAEHCITMILSLFNRLNIADLEVKKGQWNREQNRGIELKGKTIGIIGYGHMGEAFAKRLQGFETEVIAFDKYKKNYGSDMVEEVDLDEFFGRTEILSIHLPLNEETQGLIDEQFINRFEHDIYLINTARGKNIVTTDLIQALEMGKVKGACLDVLEFEDLSFEGVNFNQLPEAFQYLSKSEKVVLSPHVAGWTKESYYKLSTVLADKILEEFTV